MYLIYKYIIIYFVLDDADNFIIPDPPEIDLEDHKILEHKPANKLPHQQHKAIKIEIEDEEQNIEPKPKKLKVDNAVTLEENSPKSVHKNVPKTRSEAKAFKKDLDVLFNKAVITNDNEVTRIDDDDNKKRIRTDKEQKIEFFFDLFINKVCFNLVDLVHLVNK